MIAIFLIITTVTLLRQSKFSSDLLITNLAYEVALTIREAQVYGIGSRVADTDNPSRVRVGYGVHFAQQPNDSYSIFINEPNVEGEFDDFLFNQDTEEVFDTVDITRDQSIRRFCVSNGAAYLCSDDVDDDIDWLDISFVKPNPDAHIWAGQSGESGNVYSNAVIVVESSLGDKCRAVYVSSVGQMYVDPIPTDSDTCAHYDNL